MATYSTLSGQSNFSSSTTWFQSDSVGDQLIGPTSQLVTTTIQYSANVTLGVGTFSGVLLQVSSISANPAGTLSVVLQNTSLNTTLASVIINAKDLNPNGNGWYFFNMGNVVTVGATTYAVGVSSSVTNTVGLFRNATTNNWNTAYITTTNANPTTGDTLFITTEMVGQGLNNPSTVIMDNNTTVKYNQLDIGPSASLLYSTSAATNLSFSGNHIFVWGSGKFEMGNAGTPVSAGLTAQLTMACSANNSCSFVGQSGSVINVYGAQLSPIYRTLLTNDFLVGQSSLVVKDNTGWRAGDQIIICGTASSKSERLQVSSTGSGSIVTTTNALFGHSGSAYSSYAGTFDARADVFNLSRNAYITTNGLSAAASASTFNLGNCLSANIYYAEFAGVGMNITQNSGTSNVFYSSFHDGFGNIPDISNVGLLALTGNCGNVTVSSNFIYNVSNLALFHLNNPTQTGGTFPIVNSNIFCRSTGNGTRFDASSASFCNNVINDAPNGINMNVARPFGLNNMSFSGGIFYGLNGPAFRFAGAASWADYSLTGYQFNYMRVYACINFMTTAITPLSGIIFNSCTGFSTAASSPHFSIGVAGSPGEIKIINGLFASKIPSTVINFVSSNFFISNAFISSINNTVLGVSGSFSGYTTSDIPAMEFENQIKCYSCSSEFLSPSQQLSPNIATVYNSFVSFQDHQGLTGNNFSYWRGGKISRNTLSAQSGFTECLQLTPNVTGGATIPLRQTFYYPVTPGQTRSITASLMVDSSYSGATSLAPQLTIQYLGQVIANQSYNLSANFNSYSACVISANGSNFNENGMIELDIDCFGSLGNLYVQSTNWT